MATDDRSVHLDASAKACRAVRKAAAISWAIPADRRLDQLVELANNAGAATNRGELAAALVAAAAADGPQLLQQVLAWRVLAVREVVEETAPDAEVIVLPRYGPGRRRGSA